MPRVGPAPPIALALVSALTVAGCAGTKPLSTPEHTVTMFGRALSDGDYQHAYDLLSSAYRSRVSLEAFRRALEENQAETLALTHALSRPPVSKQQETRLRYHRMPAAVRVVTEAGQLRIDGRIVRFYDQSTPRAALRTFVRALASNRFDVILRLVPEAYKEGVSADSIREAWSGERREDIERLLHNLRQALDAPIERTGERATLAYADHKRVQFVREQGLWKIETPE